MKGFNRRLKMIEITAKIDQDRFTIELSNQESNYRLWIFNKSISEHVSIILTKQELAELVGMATTLL